MNKAIIDNNVLGTKAEQEAKFAEFAKAQNNAEYAGVVKRSMIWLPRQLLLIIN